MSSQWKDVSDEDDRSPFGEEAIDAIVYVKDERNVELGTEELFANLPPRPIRQPPREPVRQDHPKWKPSAPVPERIRTWKRPNPLITIIIGLIPLLLAAGLVYFFVGVYQGRYLGEGTVPATPIAPKVSPSVTPEIPRGIIPPRPSK